MVFSVYDNKASVYYIMAHSILHPNTTSAINPMLDDTIIYAFHKSKTHYL